MKNVIAEVVKNARIALERSIPSTKFNPNFQALVMMTMNCETSSRSSCRPTHCHCHRCSIFLWMYETTYSKTKFRLITSQMITSFLKSDAGDIRNASEKPGIMKMHHIFSSPGNTTIMEETSKTLSMDVDKVVSAHVSSSPPSTSSRDTDISSTLKLCQKGIDDQDKGKFFCIYYEDNR